MHTLLRLILALTPLALLSCVPTTPVPDKNESKDDVDDTVDADGDGFNESDDCDDTNAAINAAASEICDGIDNDCDALTDDADDSLDASTTSAFNADADGDTYGDAAVTANACAAPAGYVTGDDDCDDTNAAIHPGADESDCEDATDYNCDGSAAREDADTDGWAACQDCDDGVATINPDAQEVCDGLDNDCDTAIDDADPSLATATTTDWYADTDADGYGDEATKTSACEAPAGAIAAGTGFDCNDADAAIHPGADESDCSDPTDYNCDGSAAYADADADGWAACEECDDRNAAINPDAVEICDDIDNDCNSTVDDADAGLDTSSASTWYMDADADTYGDAANSLAMCDQPSGYVADATDCNDADSTYHPGASEADCSDPNDYNCDGSVAYADADADTWAACEECDDADSAINPDASEICDDIDNDCDGNADDADDSLDTTTASTWYADSDVDRYGDVDATMLACDQPTGYVTDTTDCDDTETDVNPAAIELCDGIDNDCNGDIDDADAALDLSSATTWYEDADHDGFGNASLSRVSCLAPTDYVANDDDCDDTDDEINPDAPEVCDGIDNDCDADIDDADASLDLTSAETWYLDDDADGFGDARTAVTSCIAPSHYVSDAQDCDDTEEDINPDAIEVCNGSDDDCNGDTDDDDAGLDVTTATTWYADGDVDTFGDPEDSLATCVAPSGYIADSQDCNDGDAAINPDALEVCDDVDNDCNSATDDDDAGLDSSTGSTWYTDSDADGYGVSTGSTLACEQPSGYASNTTDCDDALYARNPGATEACANAIDEDCDSSYSEGCSSVYVSCGGSGAMDVGNTFSCDLGATLPVDTIYVSVGCNDGETGSYTVTFDDGSSESFTGSCGSSHAITQRLTRTMTLYMASGGGGDTHISFTCCGSAGWGMYYR